MALSPQKTLALVAPQRLEGLEKFPEAERSILAAINGARVDLLRAAGRPVATNLRTTGYLAREEEYVRAAPGSGGMTLQLPKATRNNLGARITVLLESVAHADLFVQAIGGTVNTAASLQLGAVGRVDFISNGETGWFSERSIAGSTSIVESGGEYQLAAGTGDVTWAQNSTVTTIAALAVTTGKLANDAVTVDKLADSSVVPANLVASITFGVPFLVTQALSGGAAGTADDVTIYNADAPFAFRILDCWAILNAAVVGSTIQLRTATGGGGSALSSALSSAATGTVRNNDTATRQVAAAGSVFVRRSDRAAAGRVLILALRE